MDKRTSLLLRTGVAFAFLYPPLSVWIFGGDPSGWTGYFPELVRGYVADTTLLTLFEVVEVVIALWILSGWRILIPCALATFMLAAIVIFNGAQFVVLFRDISIAAMALALALDARHSKAS